MPLIVSRVRFLLIAGLAAAGAFAALALLNGATAGAAGTCTIYWTGASSTAWNANANWSASDGGASAGRTPTTTDVVCMSTNPTRTTVVYPSQNKTYVGLNFTNPTTSLEIQGGTLTVNTNAGTINNLTFDGGTLAGSAAMSLTGAVSFPSGSVTFLGAAKTVASGATLTATAGIYVGGTTSGQSGSFVNAGTATLTATTVGVATSPSAGTASSFANTGSLTLKDGTSLFVNGSGAKAPVTTNSGTLTASGTSPASIYTPFTNTGTVATTNTGLVVGAGNAAGTTDTGTWSTGSNAAGTLVFNGGTRAVTAGSFTGTTGLAVQGGTTTFSAGVTISNLALSAGTISGTVSVGVGAFTGGLLTGTGTMTLTGTGSTLCNPDIDSGYTVTNAGTASIDTTNCQGAYLTNAGHLTNTGSLTITGSGGGFPVYDDGSAGNTFLNDTTGTLTVTLTNAASTASVTPAFTNKGSVSITVGTLDLYGGSITSTTDTGTVSLAATTSLRLDGGTRTIASATVTGPGTLAVGGATVTFTGTPTVSNLALSAGTISGTVSVGVGAFTGGLLTGTGTMTLTGTGSTLCNPDIDSGYTVTNAGTASIDTTNCQGAYLTNAGHLTNTGSLTITGSGGGFPVYDDGSAGNTFLNDTTGTLTVTLTDAASTASVTPAFTNKGSVSITVGTLDLYGGSITSTTDTGTVSLAATTSLRLDGGTRTIASATVTGPGTLAVGGATVTFTGTPTVSNLALSAGTISGTVSVGVGAFTGGLLTGTGTMTLTGTGSTLCNPDIDSGYTVTNAGTASIDTTNCQGAYLTNAGHLTNTGSLTITGSGGGFPVYDDGSAGNTFLNDTTGALTVTLTNAASTASVTPKFTNNGSLFVTKGSFQPAIVGNLTAGGAFTGGTWNATGGTLALPVAVTTNAATVVIGNGGAVTVSGGGAAFATLTTNTGSFTTTPSLTTTTALTTSGTLTVAGGTLRANSVAQTAGTTTVAAGAILRSGASGTAAVTISGGTLRGTGTVQGAVSAAGGSVAPGLGGSGSLLVTGTFVSTSTGTLAVTAGTAATSVTASGAVTAGGTLAVTTSAPAPALGTSVTVLSGTSRTGTFATVTGVDVPASGGYWQVGYTPTAVTLTLVAYPNATVGNVTVAEGNSGTSTATFTVTLSAASPVAATVNYATANGTATAGSDYTATSGTLTFAPGVTSQTFPVTIIGDTLYEADETFAVQLSAGTGVTTTTNGTGTITNDDTAPALAVGDAGGVTSAAGGGSVVFPVSLSVASGLPVTVSYATSDGTATAPADYTSTSGTLTIPAGATSATVTVPLATRSTYAPPKTFTLTLSNPIGATISDGTAVGTITNANPNGPTVSGVTPAQAAQGVALPVTINGAGFGAGSTVTVSGTGVTVSGTTVVNATTITATFTSTNTTPVGARNVTVTSAGLSDTCTGCFTVVARPLPTAVDHPILAIGNTDVVMTVSGSQFQAGADVVLVSGAKTIPATSTTTNSSSSVTAVLTVPRGQYTGSWNVQVVNPDGGKGSCLGCVTIFAAPTLSGVSSPTLARGSSTSVTITGTNFVSGAVVSVPGAQLSNVVVVNATTITATVRVPATAATGARTVKVINPVSAGSGSAQLSRAITVT